jgi:hypothetical protein
MRCSTSSRAPPGRPWPAGTCWPQPPGRARSSAAAAGRARRGLRGEPARRAELRLRGLWAQLQPAATGRPRCWSCAANPAATGWRSRCARQGAEVDFVAAYRRGRADARRRARRAAGRCAGRAAGGMCGCSAAARRWATCGRWRRRRWSQPARWPRHPRIADAARTPASARSIRGPARCGGGPRSRRRQAAPHWRGPWPQGPVESQADRDRHRPHPPPPRCPGPQPPALPPSGLAAARRRRLSRRWIAAWRWCGAGGAGASPLAW